MDWPGNTMNQRQDRPVSTYAHGIFEIPRDASANNASHRCSHSATLFRAGHIRDPPYPSGAEYGILAKRVVVIDWLGARDESGTCRCLRALDELRGAVPGTVALPANLFWPGPAPRSVRWNRCICHHRCGQPGDHSSAPPAQQPDLMPLEPLQERITRTALALPEAVTLALASGDAMIVRLRHPPH